MPTKSLKYSALNWLVISHCSKNITMDKTFEEYSLTETGKSLMPALKPLIDWALEHFNEVAG